MEHFSDDIRRELEGFEVGEVVELFTVDARDIGGAVYRFASATVQDDDGAAVFPSFGGVVFDPLPFESEGWDFSAGGTLPQPTIRFAVSREDGDAVTAASFLLSLVNSLDDLLGARVLRVQTLRRHLDDGSDPNPQAHMGIEVYTVARKTNQTATLIEFQLQSALDLEDVLLPRRQILNFCQWRYRRPRPDGGFDYDRATCPYTGADRFDAKGNPVASDAADQCGKQLRDCKLRFGENGVLPFGGFPAAGKLTRG